MVIGVFQAHIWTFPQATALSKYASIVESARLLALC